MAGAGAASFKVDNEASPYAFDDPEPTSSSSVPYSRKAASSTGVQTKVGLRLTILQGGRAHLVANLGWVDLDLGSSPGWSAATAATYCPSRMV